MTERFYVPVIKYFLGEPVTDDLQKEKDTLAAAIEKIS